MNADGLNALSEQILRGAFAVANTLGCGFLEKVYENALTHELRKAGLVVAQQRGIVVTYDGVVVGEYAVDLLVEGAVLVELKAVKALDDVHLAQCLNYLRATGLHLCLLLNFGKPRLEIRRIVRDHPVTLSRSEGSAAGRSSQRKADPIRAMLDRSRKVLPRRIKPAPIIDDPPTRSAAMQLADIEPGLHVIWDDCPSVELATTSSRRLMPLITAHSRPSSNGSPYYCRTTPLVSRAESPE